MLPFDMFFNLYLEEKITEVADTILCEVELKSVSGIGDKLATSKKAGIGDAKKCKNAKQLIADAELDPSVYAAVKFVNYRNNIQ